MYVDPTFIPPEQTRKIGAKTITAKQAHKKWDEFNVVLAKLTKGVQVQSKT